jgi:hypothetical protein
MGNIASLAMAGVWGTVTTASAVVCFFIVDRLGRRPILVGFLLLLPPIRANLNGIVHWIWLHDRWWGHFRRHVGQIRSKQLYKHRYGKGGDIRYHVLWCWLWRTDECIHVCGKCLHLTGNDPTLV